MDYLNSTSQIQSLQLTAVGLLTDLADWYHEQGQFGRSVYTADLVRKLRRRMSPLHQSANLAEQAAAVAADYGRRVLDRDYWILHHNYSQRTEQ